MTSIGSVDPDTSDIGVTNAGFSCFVGIDVARGKCFGLLGVRSGWRCSHS